MGCILALKSAKVGEYRNEKNLSATNSTLMEIDPDVPESHNLAEWFVHSQLFYLLIPRSDF